MNTYSFRIKIIILGFILLIIMSTFGLNHYLVLESKKDAKQQIEKITKIYSEKVNSSDVDELTIILDVLLPSITFPLIITTEGEIYAVRNLDIIFDPSDEKSIKSIKSVIDKMDSNYEPIPIQWSPNTKSLIHYGNTDFINKIQWIPYIQFGLLIGFITLILFSLHLISNREKDKLWVGMTRETAHQLGTPISSLLGWLSLLREENVNEKILNSMDLDLNRLEKITDRFNKIGSKPKMIEVDLLDLSNEITDYIKNRIPKSSDICINVDGYNVHVKGARTLLGWAIENLLKNSIDACSHKKSEIKIILSKDSNYVNLDVMDNGEGISKSNWKNIFNAGYSKKKKGWGLGLSLTKRIIENIHNGKIYVLISNKKSTIIRMKLPKYKG
tara:strand:- start:460 stop:1617 length:1158 start_codon:yes stop_codon:yes gene_type:complete